MFIKSAHRLLLVEAIEEGHQIQNQSSLEHLCKVFIYFIQTLALQLLQLQYMILAFHNKRLQFILTFFLQSQYDDSFRHPSILNNNSSLNLKTSPHLNMLQQESHSRLSKFYHLNVTVIARRVQLHQGLPHQQHKPPSFLTSNF